MIYARRANRHQGVVGKGEVLTPFVAKLSRSDLPSYFFKPCFGKFHLIVRPVVLQMPLYFMALMHGFFAEVEARLLSLWDGFRASRACHTLPTIEQGNPAEASFGGPPFWLCTYIYIYICVHMYTYIGTYKWTCGCMYQASII